MGKFFSILLFLFLVRNALCFGQDFTRFELKTDPTINFTFGSLADYQRGIVKYNVMKLKVYSDRQFDLKVKASTANWLADEYYSQNGNLPDIDLLQLNIRNSSNTSLISGFFNITNTDQYLIGSTNTDLAVACPLQGTNQAGNWSSNRNCYEFTVDMKIKPGIELRAGLYTVNLIFTIIDDL